MVDSCMVYGGPGVVQWPDPWVVGGGGVPVPLRWCTGTCTSRGYPAMYTTLGTPRPAMVHATPHGGRPTVHLTASPPE